MTGLFTLVEREIVRFLRQRSRVIGALLTPLLFWLLIGSGIGSSFSGSGGETMNFREYFFPGTLVLIVFFTAIFSTISVIEDRKEGFLQSVLVSPVPRSALAAGKILGGSILAVAQGTLFLALAPFAGIPLTVTAALTTVATLALVAVGLTGLGFVIAWRMDSTQGFHAIMNVFLIPLWLLSGAAFPAAGASGWLKVAMALNPVSYGVAAVRRALYAGGPAEVTGVPSFAAALIVSAGFALFMLAASTWVVGRRTAVHG